MMSKSYHAYVGFGANLGDTVETFRNALKHISGISTTQILGHSRLYKTEPVGLSDGGPNFLNGVIWIKTKLNPFDLITSLRQIERILGKSIHHKSSESRKIDLDLLMFSDFIIKTDDLIIPHPRMHERAFVLLPLADLNPDLIHPIMGVSVDALLAKINPGDLAGATIFSD